MLSRLGRLIRLETIGRLSELGRLVRLSRVKIHLIHNYSV